MTALWVVIPRLTFANSCLATVFYAVGMVMVCQNGHIGSRLKAMVIVPGAWTVGSVCAGFTVIPTCALSDEIIHCLCGLCCVACPNAQYCQGSSEWCCRHLLVLYFGKSCTSYILLIGTASHKS